MSGMCSTHWIGEEYVQVQVERPGRRRPLEHLRVDRRIILKIDLKRVEWEQVDWICLAQDMDQWRAVVSKGNQG
jgi:hypothetical protein